MILYLALIGALAYDCKFTLPDGSTIDLSPVASLSPPDYEFYSADGRRYIANICGETFRSCGTDTTGVASQ